MRRDIATVGVAHLQRRRAQAQLRTANGSRKSDAIGPDRSIAAASFLSSSSSGMHHPGNSAAWGARRRRLESMNWFRSKSPYRRAAGAICAGVSDGCFLRPYASRRSRAAAAARPWPADADRSRPEPDAGGPGKSGSPFQTGRLLPDLREHGTDRDGPPLAAAGSPRAAAVPTRVAGRAANAQRVAGISAVVSGARSTRGRIAPTQFGGRPVP